MTNGDTADRLRESEVEELVLEAVRDADVAVDSADVEISVERGVRLRTNVQAGKASERAEVTLELHSLSMDELESRLDAYNDALSSQLGIARAEARGNNQ